MSKQKECVQGKSVVVGFRKVAKPTSTDGNGERWEESDKTNTLNGYEFHSEVRTPEIVVFYESGQGYCSPCIDRGQETVVISFTNRASDAGGGCPKP